MLRNKMLRNIRHGFFIVNLLTGLWKELLFDTEKIFWYNYGLFWDNMGYPRNYYEKERRKRIRFKRERKAIYNRNKTAKLDLHIF